MERASGEQQDWRQAVRGDGLLVILLILIFGMSLLILSPASAQTGGMDEDPAADRSDEVTITRLQAAYETRLAALFEKARNTDAVRVIVQLQMPFYQAEGLLGSAQANEQRTTIAVRQADVVERLAQRFDINKMVINRFETIPYFALTVDEEQLETLRVDPDVMAIEEDVVFSPTLYQSVPLIEADVAHNLGYTGAGQVVAVLDSGVIKDHPFLAGKVVSEACYSISAGGETQSLCPSGALSSTASNSARDCPPFIHGCGHGTHVTGIVAGNQIVAGNLPGLMSGVAPDAGIIAIKVVFMANTIDLCGKNPGPPCVKFYTDNVVNGLEKVFNLRNTYNIAAVNLSLGIGRYYDTAICDSENPSLKAVIDNLRAVGIATVATSGNDGWSDSLSAPACISSAISVGATTKSDQVPNYSNSASFLKLLAPGGDGPLPSSTTRIFSSGVVPSAVSTGYGYSCGVRSNGTVACRGSNAFGEATPPAGVFTQVSSGYGKTCGVRSDDGTLACWGDNIFGDLTPPTGVFTQIDAGDSHSCGVRSDGTLACWGNNTYGQATPPTGVFTQVSVGHSHSCGVRSDGTVACWGSYNFFGSVSPTGVFTQVNSTFAGDDACGVRSDGTLACWGFYNEFGQATPPAGVFTQVSLSGVHACGVHSDGTLACWGRNYFGEATPPTGGFTQVSSGYDDTCGVRSDGTVACWGSNSGQLTLPADPWAGFRFLHGTSMAAPHVAGAWAVLKSKKPSASVDEILYALRATGKPITDNRNGLILPRIDVAAALEKILISQPSAQHTAGLYNSSTGTFYLRNSNSAGVANVVFRYGPTGRGWVPLVGDWDGNGTDTVGLYSPASGTFHLRNSNSAGVANMAFRYGPANVGWIPLVGDWDGNGTDTVGLFNPASGTFYLRNSNSAGVANVAFRFGPANAGWVPLVGDWDGNGTDTVGLFDPVASAFYLRNSHSGGTANVSFRYGPAGKGWAPLMGDWNGNGTDTAGLFDPVTSTFYLKNSNAAGVGDVTFRYGPANAGWTPLAGDWNGPGL